MIRCRVIQKQIEKRGHEFVEDIWLRRNVSPDHLHRWLLLVVVEEHIRGNMVNGSCT
jgi:hypothetical protein